MRLLERDYPLRVLADHASDAASGRGSVVLVAGEAGIGKSVLLRAFAEDTIVPVLWGMCDSLSTPRPLGPLRDVAADLGPAVTGELRNATSQHEIFAATLAALQDRPRTLIIEDLHWGDEATLDLVRFLGRRISALPLLLVITYREARGRADPLRSVLGDLVAAPDARRLQLVPLSRAAVAELVAGHALDARDVHARTAGNPFFVSQIVAAPDSPLPDSVRDAVIARTVTLSADERAALELLSCAPEGVSGDLLAALRIPPATVAALGGTGLLERRGHRVAFRHEIARSAVLDAAPPGTETALHAAMIEALETVGGDPSVLTHHAAATADADRIVRYARAAGAQAARSGAHREAVSFYELALEHIGDGDTAGRAEVLEALSQELYLTDRLTDAIETRTQALALRQALGHVVAVGADHCAISLFQWYAADRDAAQAQDDAAIAVLSGAGDRRALGYALANRAYLAGARGDIALGRQASHDALQIAEELGDEALNTVVVVSDGVVRLSSGDEQARTDLLAAHDAGRRLHLDEVATVPMSYLAHFDVELGRLERADVVLARAIPFSEERQIPICSMWQRGVQARLRLFQGRWQEAESDALTVLAAGDIPLGRLWAHLVLGLLVARRDAPPQNPNLDEVWALARKIDLAGLVAPAAAALAEQAWITRRLEPRLDDASVAAAAHLPTIGGSQLRQWLRRLGADGLQRVGAELAPPSEPAGPQLPYDHAMALWDAGSTDELLTALSILDDLDAGAAAARVRAQLRELGVANPPRKASPRTRANPGGLTERQLGVLALLTEGLSNADIAARLVISRKTADHHVSAILGKLGARSRGEAVATARRLGLDDLTTPAVPARPGAH